MKTYVITGSLGHISKPIVEGLIKAGQKVRVVTSSAERVAEIEKLGATAFTGSLTDVKFLTSVFAGADVVYTMIPPIWKTSNWRASQNEVGNSFIDALKATGIKYVVNLSSIGAHAGNGVGPVDGLYDFEQQLNAISGLQVKHLRPSFFFYNFFAQIALIKQAGIMGGNYGNGNIYLVHTDDIAAAALEELLSLQFAGNSVRYIIGDERTGSEIAAVLGKAIGKEISWVDFSDEQQKQGLLQAGLSETHAQGYTDLGTAIRTGLMQDDARKATYTKGKITLEDFAKEFATAFNN